MTLVVPFDGSELAEAALVRAAEFCAIVGGDVLAVSVIPEGNTSYARQRSWISPDESFDVDAIVGKLRERVTGLCPACEFHHEVVDRYAPPGAISNRVRRVAREQGATMVFIGSENAGHMVTSLSSVGGGIAADEAYDVTIVRHPNPGGIAEALSEAERRDTESGNRS